MNKKGEEGKGQACFPNFLQVALTRKHVHHSSSCVLFSAHLSTTHTMETSQCPFFNTERYIRETANTNYCFFGLTRLKIEPKSAVLVADDLFLNH